MLLKGFGPFIFILLVVSVNSFGDFCKQHECSIEVETVTNVYTSYKTITQHTIADNTFVYYINVTFTSNANKLRSNDSVTMALNIFDMLDNPCKVMWCWMHIIYKTDQPFEYIDIDGYYDYDNNTLGIYPKLNYIYPIHNDTIYEIHFLICVMNPSTPHYNLCLNFLPIKKLTKK